MPTIKEIKNQLSNKNISVQELYNDYYDKAKKSKLNSFNHLVDPEYNKENINSSQARYDGGKDLPLDGIPLGIKDLFCTKGVKTTAGSKMLENFIPNYESRVTQNLLNDGSLFLGKNNCDEFAMGSSNETSFYGNVENPWENKNNTDSQLVPGGSSGGSASAVAEGICVASIGTDTGGSIRQPASLCGVVGSNLLLDHVQDGAWLHLLLV